MSDRPSQKRSLDIHLGWAMVWVFSAPVLAGGAGAVVTWRLVGTEGVWAEGAAFGVAAFFAAVSVVGLRWLARRAARDSKANVAFVVAQAFVFGGLARMVFLVLAGLAVWYAAGLATRPFFVWLATFGFLTLIGESIALTRAMKSDTNSGESVTSDQ